MHTVQKVSNFGEHARLEIKTCEEQINWPSRTHKVLCWFLFSSVLRIVGNERIVVDNSELTTKQPIRLLLLLCFVGKRANRYLLFLTVWCVGQELVQQFSVRQCGYTHPEDSAIWILWLICAWVELPRVQKSSMPYNALTERIMLHNFRTKILPCPLVMVKQSALLTCMLVSWFFSYQIEILSLFLTLLSSWITPLYSHSCVGTFVTQSEKRKRQNIGCWLW